VWPSGENAVSWAWCEHVLPCAALANKVRLRRLEEWKREELRRTLVAILDEPPAELRPTKGSK